jgi:uncharacterized membrane protein YdbT with pleckstrin-like domain
MAYIEQTLGANERLVSKAHFHWMYYAAAALALVTSLGIAALLVSYDFAPFWAWTATLIGLVAFLSILVPIWTTEIGVTTQRLVLKRGVIKRNIDELQLWAIESVNLQQSLLGRLLGFGRLVAQGTGDDSITLPVIADPLSFRKAIQDAIGHASQPNITDIGEARGHSH